MNPDRLARAIRLAAERHAGQCVPGTRLPYLLHLAQVATEVQTALAHPDGQALDPERALLCAWLHDTLEDTDLKRDELVRQFGEPVAAGVDALTKRMEGKSKREAMDDSLSRILEQPAEIALVKLCDRIVNLQPPPPHWNIARQEAYRDEAKRILQRLKGVHPAAEKRLRERIEAYGRQDPA